MIFISVAGLSLLWKLTKNGKTSYLFGTLHTDDEDIVTLPREVKQAFDNSVRCAFEASPNIFSSSEHVKSVAERFSKWKKTEVSPANKEEYTAYKYNARQIIASILPQGQPATIDAWVNEKTPIGLLHKLYRLTRSPNHLDLQLINQALLQKTEIFYLDDPEYLSDVLNGYCFTFEEQMELYKERTSLPNNEDNAFMDNGYINAKPLQNIYLSDSPLEKLMAAVEPKSAVSRKYHQVLVEQRDEIFVNKLKPQLASGDIFIAVGALHLPGMLKQLAQEGYTVEAVALSAREHPINVENFANLSFLQELPIKELPSFVDRVKASFLPHMKNSLPALTTLCQQLDDRRFKIIYKKLAPELGKALHSLTEFISLITGDDVSKTKRKLIIKTMGYQLIAMLRRKSDFNRLIGHLTPRECDILYAANRKDILSSLIEPEAAPLQSCFSQAQQDLVDFKELGTFFKSFTNTTSFAIALLAGNDDEIKIQFANLVACTNPTPISFFKIPTFTSEQLRKELLNLKLIYKEKIMRALHLSQGAEEIKQPFEDFIDYILLDSQQKRSTLPL